MRLYSTLKFFNKEFIFISCFLSGLIVGLNGQQPQRYTVSGYVKEAGSGESLIGVNVYLSDRKTGTVTNNYGFFSLTLPESDSVELVISYVGFNPEIRKITLRKNIELSIELRSDLLLREVTISAERAERLMNSEKRIISG